MEVQLSVAIVTRNRPDSLEKTLESLSKQDPGPFEIVISDDSNSEHHVVENKKIVSKYGGKYVSGPQRGLYANRNFVAKQCIGTHIRTMDDDHDFPEGHIKACIDAIISDSKAIWTAGEYYKEDIERPLPSPVPGQLHPRGYAYKPKDMQQYRGISCGFTIYPRSVIDKNILNNENFKFGPIYLEYGARLFNKGYRIKHLADTYIVHRYEENETSFSADIINSSKVFCMLMLSFKHVKSVRNKLLTLTQISMDIATRKYSLQLVLDAFSQFKNESKK